MGGEGLIWPWHRHAWEPKAVHYFQRSWDGERGVTRTNLLECCRCGARRQTEWMGMFTLDHFKPTPKPARELVEDLIRKGSIQGGPR